jgi:type IV pilus assembly protein PilX
MFVTVVLVLIISVIALAVFQQAGFDEKSARGQYDRQVATQAAELAIRDAEMDLACMQMPPAGASLASPVACVGGTALLRQPNPPVTPARVCRQVCTLGAASKLKTVGLKASMPTDLAHAGKWLGPKAEPAVPASGSTAGIAAVAAVSPATVRAYWDNSASNLASVALGQFTGTPDVPNVARQPRYLIEAFTVVDGDVDHAFYRITAKGWGRNPNTEITLQQLYKP